MSDLTPVILDPGSSQIRNGRARTLLTVPVGTESLLDLLVSRLLELPACGTILVVSAAGAACIDDLKAETANAVRVIGADEFSSRAAAAEASDFYLLIDPRYWPHGGHDLPGLLREANSYRGSTHVVSISAPAGGPLERVECDEGGHIRCVRRMYSEHSWADDARARICCSLVPAKGIAGLPFTSLKDLRLKLIERGLLNQDIAVSGEVFDLHQPEDLLRFCEQNIKRALDSLPAGFRVAGSGIIKGSGGQVHPSAVLVPPIVLQREVTIEDGVRVIGPTVIGTGSRIQRNATVVRSLVAQDTNLAPETHLYQFLPDVGEVWVARDREAAPLIEAGQQSAPAQHRWHRYAKRALDVSVAGLLLVGLFPLLIVVTILIKLSSPGPVFFTHRREARGGVEFPCIKFRTMEARAHSKQRELYRQNQVDGPQFKLQNDPRVTRIGRWLRNTNLDELPQLLNVLVGHMSLVGPRPSPFRENQICVPWRRARLSVPPGITGVWQLCRDKRWSEGDFHQWIFYDMAYVRHFSFWLDLKILVHTVLTLGGRRRLPLQRLIPAYANTGNSEEPRSSVAVN